ncbi:MAG: peptidyl-prolyl cis-trans isomerase [Candidatus Omnitrophota bacterium]
MNAVRFVSALFLILTFSFAAMAGPAAAMEDAIIAVVNDDVITLKDLKDYIHTVYNQLRAQGMSGTQLEAFMERVKTEGLDRLIEDRLVLSAANKMGFEASPAAVDEELAKMKQPYPDEQAFVEDLTSRGLTVSDLRAQIEDRLKGKAFINQVIRPRVRVRPQDITEYYQQNTKQFQVPERVDLDSIFIRSDEGADKAGQQAEEAIKRIEAGEDFRTVALEYSKLPPLGMVVRGQLKPEIEQRVFALDEGEVSQPIEQNDGIFIFKVREKFPAAVAPLNEVKEDVSRFLFEKRLKDEMKSWLAEQKKDAYIEVKEAPEL